MKTKIYEFRINCEKEWVCADTLVEALKAYCDVTDMGITDFDADDDIVEVPKEKWPLMDIMDTDAEYDEENGYPVIMTFSEYMEKEAIRAQIISTTNP